MTAGDVITRESVIAPSTSQRVARNSVLYFASVGVTAVAALIFVPVSVRALGAARFGLLALSWAIAESTGVFDFGLGKATIRFVADASVRSTQRLRDIVTSSLITQTAMGILAGLIFFLITPFLVNRVFSIATGNIAEARAMFRVLALHMPVLLFLASLRASLEGAQRFDISTPLRVPGSVAGVVVPAWAAFEGYSLSTILWVLLAVRIALAVVTAIMVRRTLLDRWALPSQFSVLREMLGYSGWVAASTAIGPALGSMDRFAVGSIVGGAGLGYYGGAAEAANRFLLVPVTAFSAVFPALAAVDASHGRDRALEVTRAARRQLVALMFPLCLALFVFGPQLLGLWLGAPFSAAAGTALRILAVSVFLAGVAMLPLALLYGSGRPDLPAKINLLQLSLHVPIMIFAVKILGITGAAVAMTVLRIEDLVFYEWATRRYLGSAPHDHEAARRSRVLVACSAGLLAAFSLATAAPPIASLIVAMIAFAAYGALVWLRVLSAREREAWTSMLNR